ncbi:MAG: NUDIX domain-containing protein [Acidobacteria bacterium]|nr:NUDIX domain-containing protein [Acidobacteriota bacterium]MDA1235837.1 NUDIX domain-containing protein [Acidobacteriota bacterium]
MAHIFYDLDFTVAVFVIRNGQVLLVRHRKLEKWLPIGGHIEIGENPEEAALRETLEESGLKVELVGAKPPREFPGTQILTAPSYLDVHDISGDHRHIGLIYFSKSAEGEPRLATAEHHDIRRFTPAELAAPEWAVPEAIQFYAHEALAKLAEST